MTITYRFNIRQLSRTTVYGLPDIISHVHFDYVGTNEAGDTTFCQGVVPFQLTPQTTTNPATGATTTIPAVFDKNNYIPYDQITDEIVVDWLNNAVHSETIEIFKHIIGQKLTEQE